MYINKYIFVYLYREFECEVFNTKISRNYILFFQIRFIFIIFDFFHNFQKVELIRI
jgi:hypothetical protein